MTDLFLPGPRLIEREAQPYVGVRERVTLQAFGAIVARLPEVFGWLAERQLPPAGAPCFRYHSIDDDGHMEVEAGVPVAPGIGDAYLTDDAVVTAGLLPAGRFVTTTHIGHPDGLFDATAHLLEWAARRNLEWDREVTETGQRWGCRLEVYHTDPGDQPDLNKWETDLVFRLADMNDRG